MADHYSHTSSKGVTYYLYSKEVTLRAGKRLRIYFFNKQANLEQARKEPEVPAGYRVNQNPRNGFLTVVRKDMDQED